MTQEEKAIAYDKAIKVAENIHRFSSDPAEIKRMEQIFPELKENKDEEIRKEIIEQINLLKSATLSDLKVNQFNSWIDWLEKQGENANFFNKIQIGDKVTRNRDGVLVNLSQLNRVAKPAERQQKPAWSEEPLSDIENRIINFAMQFHDNRMKPEAEWEDELKMLRDNIKIDPWSEEDEEIYNLLCEEYKNLAYYSHSRNQERDILGEILGWLKSLKNRYTWKPSDE